MALVEIEVDDLLDAVAQLVSEKTAKAREEVATALRIEFGEAIKALPQPVSVDPEQFVTPALFFDLKASLDQATARIAQYEKEHADFRKEHRELAESFSVDLAASKARFAADMEKAATIAAEQTGNFAERLSSVAESLAGLPAARDGKDCEPAAVAALVLPELRALAAEYLAALPEPKDGEDGEDGKSVTVEDFRQLFEAEQAKWALDFERRAGDVLQRAIARMPAAKDGKDGLGFDDLTAEHDGARTLTLKFKRGEQVKEFKFQLPAIIYRGVFKLGEVYTKGDASTWGGHLFIAAEDNDGSIAPDKPGSKWVQAVKRGGEGSSAYASAIKHGFVGSEKEWVESIGKPATPRTVKLGT